VALVAARTRERYAALRPGADPELAARTERVSSTEGNVAGIVRWLEKPGTSGAGAAGATAR
jgi:hypothetical protein